MPPAIPDKLPCESLQQLEQEFSALRDVLSLEETEETWDRIARALTRFSAVVKGGGYKYEKELINGIKTSTKHIVSAMNSERTRLSAAALDCLTIIAPRVGVAFEPLVSFFIPHILRLATRTNKVYVTRCQASMALIIGYCHIPSILPHLLAGCKESKIVTGRAVSVESVLRCLNKWDWTDKEIKAKVGVVEEVIKVTGRDKDAAIRQTSRKVFEAYKTLFPDRVDAFTGPLTPVMRKYLDIKPQRPVSNTTESGRPLSAQEKPKQPPHKLDLPFSATNISSASSTNARHVAHSRSASSNAAALHGSTKGSRSHPHNAGTMPPPVSVPSRARSTSRPQTQRPKPDNTKPEEHTDHERQRVLSTASSTFSVKSAPANSHSGYEHRPPVRFATSQSRAVMADSAVTASSGPARRVRRVIALEPHPANRPDFSSVVHKAPVRPTPLGGVSRPQAQKPTRAEARDPVGVVPNAPTTATGIAFPTTEAVSALATTVERKGAQRVPKPVIPSQVASPNAERPTTSMSDDVKRETKTSIFRRGAPGAPDAGEKAKIEKPKEGFAPRRGGGIMQPTLSQLSKQRTHPSASSTLASGPRGVGASVVSKRPVWGAGTKLSVLKGQTTSRVLSRSGVGKAPVAKQSEEVKQTQVQPAMIPLPASPGMEELAPEAVAISGSSETLPTEEETKQEATSSYEATVDEAPEAGRSLPESETNSNEPQADETQEATEQKATSSNEATVDEAPEVGRSLPESETNSNEPQTDETQVTENPGDEDKDIFMTDTIPRPHTPPFPTTDEDSEEDDLAAIEFTTGDAYDPAGVPIKTPGKVVSTATDIVSERNPLAEVVLNE